MAELASANSPAGRSPPISSACVSGAKVEGSPGGVDRGQGGPLAQTSSDDGIASDASESSKAEVKRHQICFDFTKGTCTRGETCKFSHDVNLIIEVNSQERGICFDYLRQSCSRGALCRFSHDLSNFDPQDSQQSSKNRNSPICYDFVKKQCSRGADCRYSHDLESIMNSTRGRQVSSSRQPPVGFNWGVSPQQLYNHTMAMAALAGSLPPLPGMLPAHMAGANGLPFNGMQAPYGHAHPVFNPFHASQYGNEQSADVAALQAMAAAAADPRTGHIAQAQILQQMQAMLAVMQPSAGAAARQAKGMGFAGAQGPISAPLDPFTIQAQYAHAANAAGRHAPGPAMHSPALAGVAQQLAANAAPHQVQSNLNVNAAAYTHDPHLNGIGAAWHPHVAGKAGHEGPNAFQYARGRGNAPASDGGQAQGGTLYMSNGRHAAGAQQHEEQQQEGQGAEGAESISGSIDLPQRRSFQHERSRSAIAALEQQSIDELPPSSTAAGAYDAAAVSRADALAQPSIAQKFGGSTAPFGEPLNGNQGTAAAERSERSLQHTAAPTSGLFHPQLHRKLPAVRTASPRGFHTAEAQLSHPNSPLLSEHAAGSAAHSPLHPTGPPAPPQSTFAEHVMGSPRSPMSASLAGLNGLSAAFGDGPVAASALPRHLSMDVASMRHIGLGQSPSEGSRLGVKHRQSSLGPAAVQSANLSELQGMAGEHSNVLNGLPSLGHATSLSDGLQHLNICQHIWRRT